MPETPAPPSADFERDVYTVSRLNREARTVLENSFPLLWVEGELSNLARPSSGHLYFSLKDDLCQVRCAMFRMRNIHLRFAPSNGQQVLVRARVGLYEGRGEFQLLVEHMEPSGEGALRRAFEELKRKLAAEGLFENVHKRPPPSFPGRIGVVTSPTGAAIRDTLSVLGRRAPGIPVIIYPVPVQGEGAGARIAEMIERAGRRGDCDVLLLVRGGGSLEDLQAFNEERVARAIFTCQLPLVTGIGHEIDFTIADLVADQRAPTPSAAAELISPDRMHWLHRVEQLWHRLVLHQRRTLNQRTAEAAAFATRLRLLDPGRRLLQQQQRADELEQRLHRTMAVLMERRRAQFGTISSRLREQAPSHMLRRQRLMFAQLGQRLEQAWITETRRRRQQLEHSAGRLQALSPLATLERGYAIVTRVSDGVIVRDPDEVATAERVQAQLARGRLICRVEKDG